MISLKYFSAENDIVCTFGNVPSFFSSYNASSLSYSYYYGFVLIISFSFSCRRPLEKVSLLKMNHIQVIGSHNSYKKHMDPALLGILMQEDSTRILTLDYGHLPLQDQLDLGMRNLEIDVYHDPDGGKYGAPYGQNLLIQYGINPRPYDTLSAMKKPGFKVLHVQDIDFRSHCFLFSQCLSQINKWSDAHPNHLPIAITINVKTEIFEPEEFQKPFPFTKDVFDLLDQEIVSVLGFSHIIIPDLIKGTFNSLEEAVLSKNWLSLRDSRGKILFILDEPIEKIQPYIEDHPSLSGRVMFVNLPPGYPESAFLVMNDPIEQQSLIRKRVRQGYLVRTRADANTLEARMDSFERFEAALTSGAHYISTDYYIPDPRLGTSYQVCLSSDQAGALNPLFTDSFPVANINED